MTLPTKETVDLFAFWASVATLAALPVALAALLYAGVQFSLARRAGSAATVIPLFDSFRECWTAYREAQDAADQKFHFAELANALEVACAIWRDGVLAGATRHVLEQYILNVFKIIESNPGAVKQLSNLFEMPETFENIAYFLELHQQKLPIIRQAVQIPEPTEAFRLIIA